jgi:hypothetical protein
VGPTATALGLPLRGCTDEEVPNEVEYHGERYAARLGAYCQIPYGMPTAEQVATYYGAQGPIPYVLHSDNLWYVNWLPSLDSDYPEADRDAPFLILADVLHDVFNTEVTEVHRAVIRLEDVSVVVGAQRLARGGLPQRRRCAVRSRPHSGAAARGRPRDLARRSAGLRP